MQLRIAKECGQLGVWCLLMVVILTFAWWATTSRPERTRLPAIAMLDSTLSEDCRQGLEGNTVTIPVFIEGWLTFEIKADSIRYEQGKPALFTNPVIREYRGKRLIRIAQADQGTLATTTLDGESTIGDIVLRGHTKMRWVRKPSPEE